MRVCWRHQQHHDSRYGEAILKYHAACSMQHGSMHQAQLPLYPMRKQMRRLYLSCFSTPRAGHGTFVLHVHPVDPSKAYTPPDALSPQGLQRAQRPDGQNDDVVGTPACDATAIAESPASSPTRLALLVMSGINAPTHGAQPDAAHVNMPLHPQDPTWLP